MNNLVIITNGQVVVSSRQVAENFGKRHDNVLRDIESLKKDVLNFEEMFVESTEPDSYGREQLVYLMNRDGFTILAMGFTGSTAMQWKLKYIQAFNEMEKQLSFKIPQNYGEALRLAADQADQLEQQAKQLEEAKPKVDFYDAVAGSRDAIGIGEVAKVLGIPGVGRNNLFATLRSKGILMTNNQPYQEYVDRGYFRVIEQKFTKPNGDTCISIKTLVYQKGVDYIRKALAKPELKAV